MTFIEEYKMNPSLCDAFIKYHQENKEYKIPGTFGGGKIDHNVKDSTDVLFFDDCRHSTIIEFFTQLKACVQSYTEKYFHPGHRVHTCNGNVIQYYKKGGGYKELHYERGNRVCSHRQLVYMLYCNTLKNGGTDFPWQKTTLQAEKGKLAIWPSDFTHPHIGVISNDQEKYIVTGWFEIV